MAQNSSKTEGSAVERAQIETEAKSQTLWSRLAGYLQSVGNAGCVDGTRLTESILFRCQRDILFLGLESRLTRHLSADSFQDRLGRETKRK
jgi:hypothetical protein